MKFNEAIDEVRSHENTYDETSGTMQTFSVLDMIDELREEYAPKIYLKKSDKEMLLYYLENANFSSLLESILSSKTSTLFGVGNIENVPFYGLSEEDIMYAWVNPNSIQIIDEE